MMCVLFVVCYVPTTHSVPADTIASKESGKRRHTTSRQSLITVPTPFPFATVVTISSISESTATRPTSLSLRTRESPANPMSSVSIQILEKMIRKIKIIFFCIMEGDDDVITLVGSDKIELVVDRARAIAASGTIRDILEDPLLKFDNGPRIELSDIPSLTLRKVVNVIDGADPVTIFEDTRLLPGVTGGIHFILALNYLDVGTLNNSGIWGSLERTLTSCLNNSYETHSKQPSSAISLFHAKSMK